MGYIDQATHTAHCPKCGITESVKILQHGSAYGASWGAEKPMMNFNVIWSDDGVHGPSITSEKCNACDTAAETTAS